MHPSKGRPLNGGAMDFGTITRILNERGHNIGRTRVCQLHARALQKLQAALRNDPELMEYLAATTCEKKH